MNSFQDNINSLTETILARELPYKNTIIIGENASGKSQICKNIIQQSNDGEYYFIDTVNRSFNVNEVSLEKLSYIELKFSESISINRILDDIFNLKDTFYWNNQVTNHIGEIYPYYKEQLNELLYAYWRIRLEIIKDVDMIAIINGKQMPLPNGYQAIIRILLELLYFDSFTKHINKKTVIIDEIDEYLHPKANATFFKFIIETFPAIDFLVTTHSVDLVASVDDCNLLVLADDSWERLDSGDYRTVSYANSLFSMKDYRDNSLTEKEKNNILIRKLLNNKMSGVWRTEDQEILEKLKGSNLTMTQKLLLRQVER